VQWRSDAALQCLHVHRPSWARINCSTSANGASCCGVLQEHLAADPSHTTQPRLPPRLCTLSGGGAVRCAAPTSGRTPASGSAAPPSGCRCSRILQGTPRLVSSWHMARGRLRPAAARDACAVRGSAQSPLWVRSMLQHCNTARPASYTLHSPWARAAGCRRAIGRACIHPTKGA
jgi:hypothetical protein